MTRRSFTIVTALTVLSLGGAVLRAEPAGKEAGGQAGPGAPPGIRMIPAITADDKFPGACVDCHVNRPDLTIDGRLSTAMDGWTAEVNEKLLATARAAAAHGEALSGKHPDAKHALDNIPGDCLQCHARNSEAAPPFSRLLHQIHLTGGEENHFLTMFQGECTHCHKLNRETGQWSVPSGPEKE